jgi:hypothetical protein
MVWRLKRFGEKFGENYENIKENNKDIKYTSKQFKQKYEIEHQVNSVYDDFIGKVIISMTNLKSYNDLTSSKRENEKFVYELVKSFSSQGLTITME